MSVVRVSRNQHLSWISLSGVQEICTGGSYRFRIINIEMVIKTKVINRSALSECVFTTRRRKEHYIFQI